MISTQLRSDGRHRAKLYVDGGPSTTKTVGHLRMEGREVFKHAVGMVTDVIRACFDDAGVTAADIDWFVPHQANRRIIDASADKLGLAREKVVVTVDMPRQHLGRLDPAGARRRGQGRPDQEGRPGDDRGDGRRLHLGRRADPVVSGGLTIGALAPDESEAAIALWREAGLIRPWNDPQADIARALAGPASTILAGRLDGRLVATAMVGWDGHRGWLYYLAVAMATRRRGYGAEMVRAAEAWLAERGAPKLNLMVRSENQAVIAFYERLGYRLADTVTLQRVLS